MRQTNRSAYRIGMKAIRQKSVRNQRQNNFPSKTGSIRVKG
jgi:hypothetical protein